MKTILDHIRELPIEAKVKVMRYKKPWWEWTYAEKMSKAIMVGLTPLSETQEPWLWEYYYELYKEKGQ